jgi:hypothetical protein
MKFSDIFFAMAALCIISIVCMPFIVPTKDGAALLMVLCTFLFYVFMKAFIASMQHEWDDTMQEQWEYMLEDDLVSNDLYEHTY